MDISGAIAAAGAVNKKKELQLLPPKAFGENNQNRHNFQTAQKHSECQEPFGGFRQRTVVSRRANQLADTGAGIA